VREHDKKIGNLSPQSGLTVKNHIFYENGDSYVGTLNQGAREGEGSYFESATGLTYNGAWHRDLRHGTGNLTSKDQEYVYDGGWEEGQKSGQGQLIYKGEKYSGSFLRDKYNGYGVHLDREGNIYEGEWAEGMKSGMGHYKTVGGDTYIGEFRGNEYNGKVIL